MSSPFPCLFVDIDPETQDFLLILEDMGDAAAGDQIAGCDSALMERVRQSRPTARPVLDKTAQLDWLRYQNVPELNQFRRDAILSLALRPP